MPTVVNRDETGEAALALVVDRLREKYQGRGRFFQMCAPDESVLNLYMDDVEAFDIYDFVQPAVSDAQDSLSVSVVVNIQPTSEIDEDTEPLLIDL